LVGIPRNLPNWRKLPFDFAGSRLSFLTPESRDRSFSGKNQLFKLAVNSAAIPDSRGQVQNRIDFSIPVIASSGSIS
jgi:hypothetical protein